VLVVSVPMVGIYVANPRRELFAIGVSHCAKVAVTFLYGAKRVLSRCLGFLLTHIAIWHLQKLHIFDKEYRITYRSSLQPKLDFNSFSGDRENRTLFCYKGKVVLLAKLQAPAVQWYHSTHLCHQGITELTDCIQLYQCLVYVSPVRELTIMATWKSSRSHPRRGGLIMYGLDLSLQH